MLLLKEYSNNDLIIFCASIQVCICYFQSAIKPFLIYVFRQVNNQKSRPGSPPSSVGFSLANMLIWLYFSARWRRD